MFCKNCGKQLGENTLFCSNCGTKIENEVVQQVEENTASVAEQEIVPEAAVATEVPVVETNQASGVEVAPPAPKKKFPKIAVAGCIAAAILAVSAFGLLFKDTIFFALAPEKYTGNLIAKTLETIGEESVKIDENITGMSLTIDDAFTAGATVEVSEEYEGGMSAKVDYAVSNDPSAAEILFNADAEVNQEGNAATGNIQGFWNDEKIGLAVSDVTVNGDDVLSKEITDKYFVVSSKNFGDDFMDSIFADLLNGGLMYADYDGVDISGLDLSYTNLKNMLNGEEFKPLIKKLKKEIIAFLEECDVSDRKSVKFRFADDKVNAKKITVTVEVEDLVDFAINALKVISEDEYVQEKLGEDMLTYLDLGIDGLKEVRSDVPEFEFDVDFVEYGGRIVEVSCEIDGEGVAIRSTDKNYALNGLEIEVFDGSQSALIEYTANWVNESEKITFEGSVSDDGSKMGTAEIEFDYDKERFEAKLSVPGVETYKIGGKCSKKDGFMLAIDDISVPQSGYVTTNSVDFDEWFDENYRYADEKNYDYYYDNEMYDELWDIYIDDVYFYSYEDWYDENGAIYDDNYMSYNQWLDEVAYNSESVRDNYNYETGESDYIDYDMVIKVSVTVKEGVSVKVDDRKHIDVFKLSEDDFEELGQNMVMGTAEADVDDINF